MKKGIFFALLFLSISLIVFAQNSVSYKQLIGRADSLRAIKDYENAARTYSEALRLNNKAPNDDRYNAACMWALIGKADSAFYQLKYLASKKAFNDYNQLVIDEDLEKLHTDKRWAEIARKVKENKDESEQGTRKDLVRVLDTVYQTDQIIRNKTVQAGERFGWQSNEYKQAVTEMRAVDSVNLIKVSELLDQYGWLGPKEVGVSGALTLFLVIQHSKLAVQEKYLPLLKEAVENKKAQGGNLALLEDRVAVRQGKKQIYGTQLGQDKTTGKRFLLPLEDPDNVDKRRAEVGLPPLAVYLAMFNIKWDVNEYKKTLPGNEK